MKGKVMSFGLAMLIVLPNFASAADTITISNSTPMVGEKVQVNFPLPNKGTLPYTMYVTSSDKKVNIKQETVEQLGGVDKVELVFSEETTTSLTASLLSGNTAVIKKVLPVTVSNSPTSSNKINIEQVNKSSAYPTVKVSLKEPTEQGSYSIVFTNKLGTPLSKSIPNNGDSTEFLLSNFEGNGDYPYVVKLNGTDISTGYIPLAVVKAVPKVKAETDGKILTLTLSSAKDYIGENLLFQSGSYESNFTISGDNDTKAFGNAVGLGKDFNILYNSNVLVNGKITSPTKPTEVDNSNKPTTPAKSEDKPQTQQPTDDSKAPVVTPEEQVDSTPTVITKSLKITTDKSTYPEGGVMSVTADIKESSQYNRAVTLRFAADSSSSIKAVTLDSKGNGKATVKMNVPFNSSQVVYVTMYAINGDIINTANVNYKVSGSVQPTTPNTPSSNAQGDTGQNNLPVQIDPTTPDNLPSGQVDNTTPSTDTSPSVSQEDKKFGDKIPSVEYASLDLTNLEKGTGDLKWYKANNVSLYSTRLILTNNTSKEEKSYKVWIGDGDGSKKQELEYMGSGIYTWTLVSGGKQIAQASYSTAIGIDKAKVLSQDGLPVVLAKANRSILEPQPVGSKEDEVNGAMIGKEVGAPEIMDQQLPVTSPPIVPQKKSNVLLIVIIAVSSAVLLGGLFLLWFKVLRNRGLGEEEYSGDRTELL